MADQDGVFQLNVDGTGLVRFSGEPNVYPSPDDVYPSPDGSRVASVRLSESGSTEVLLWLSDPDGSIPVASVAGQNTARPSWSSDGAMLVVGSATEGTLLIVNADGSGLREFAVGAAEYPETAWSPDGTKIAFVPRITQLGSGPRLAVLDVERGTAETIVSADIQPGQISWSGNGEKLAFAGFVVNSDGTALTRVTNGDGPALSPDGRYLLVGRGTSRIGEGPSPLIRVDVATLEETVLYEGQANTTLGPRSAWSPDGEKIAFVAGPANAFGIYVMNADGSGLYQLFKSFGNIVNDLGWVSEQRIGFSTQCQGCTD